MARNKWRIFAAKSEKHRIHYLVGIAGNPITKSL